MPKILTGPHAEYVGNAFVEPGDEIPADADAATIERLQAEGKIHDTGGKKSAKKEE